MIALNGDCRKCKHYGADWACCTDYCTAGHDDCMFADEDNCEYFEQEIEKMAETCGAKMDEEARQWQT